METPDNGGAVDGEPAEVSISVSLPAELIDPVAAVAAKWGAVVDAVMAEWIADRLEQDRAADDLISINDAIQALIQLKVDARRKAGADLPTSLDIDQSLSDVIERGVEAELPVPATTVPMVSLRVPVALDLDQRLRVLAEDRGVDAATLIRQFLDERVEYETRCQAQPRLLEAVGSFSGQGHDSAGTALATR